MAVVTTEERSRSMEPMRSRTLPRIALTLALAAIARPVSLRAQLPFATGKADGSIVLDKGGFVQTTFDDALFRIGYELDRRDQQWDAFRTANPNRRFRFGRRYGFELQGRPGGNIAALLDANELVSGGRAFVSLGLTDVLSFRPSAAELKTGSPPRPPFGLIYDWLTVQASIERNDVTLFNASEPFTEQFSKRRFDGYGVTLHYNAQFGGRVPTVAGVSFGMRRINNADDLAQVSVTDRRVFTAPDGSTQRTADRTRKGLSGDYAVSRPATLNTDLVFYPFLTGGAVGSPADIRAMAKASVALNLFTRSTLGSDGQFVPGVGAYVTAPGAPLKVYGGVNVYRSTDNGTAANIVAGFGF